MLLTDHPLCIKCDISGFSVYLFVTFNRLNSIREITNRCPLCINEDLLQYLVQYKTHKDKSKSIYNNST